MKETRVGYATIALLCEHLEQYIRSHTIDSKYQGEDHYLQAYVGFQKYLRDEK